MKVFAAWIGCALLATAHAETLPLWEAGIGLAALRLGDYRGADSMRSYVLPVPIFIYRGEYLRADRNGIRGMLLDTDRVELSLSASATPPVGRGNSAREGMPDLRPTIELGPLASISMLRSDDRKTKLDLRLPWRAAITLDRHPRYEGWVFAPNVNLDLLDLDGGVAGRGWNVGLLAGPVFASKRQHEYFYGVAPEFATPTRPAYSARGGYAGTQFVASLTRRFDDYFIGAYVRRDSLRGAAFEDSPLVKSTSYTSYGIGVSWMFGKSTTRVDSER